METSMSFVSSEKPITGLDLPIYARKKEGYGFNEFEISNSTISAVFRQPVTVALSLGPLGAESTKDFIPVLDKRISSKGSKAAHGINDYPKIDPNPY